MMDRQIDSPIPMPLDFVVLKASKTRSNTRPRIAHCHEDAICLALLRADRQFSWPLLNRAHCFDRIQDQVQDDLLQLNTIPLNDLFVANF
jgi:hypothetical protein